MSKYRLYYLSFLIAGVPLVCMAGSGKEFTKSIVKEFDISQNGLAGISNKYGNIDVRTWDAPRIKMEVTIKVDARSEEAANEVFNRITVTFDNSASAVRARTEIEPTASWRKWFNIGAGDEFRINYVVHIPATVELVLENKYGDIFVADKSGRTSVDLRYGDMRLGNLTGNTTISMAYADGVISGTGDLDLEMAYSDLHLSTAGNINFTGKYSDLKLGTASSLRCTTGYVDVRADKVGSVVNTGRYDDFVLGEVTTLEVTSRYSGFDVGNLTDHGRFEMGYGAVSLDRVSAGFSYIDINTSYTDVEIAVEEGVDFVLNARARYCDIRQSGLEVSENIKKSSEHIVKAHRGSQNATSRITASMNYGELIIR